MNTRRASRAAAIVLLAFLPAGCGAAAQRAPTAVSVTSEGSATYDDGAAAQLAADTGVGIAEANARVARQPAIERFSAALAVEIPDVFSGLWIDQDDHGRVVVATTSPRPAVRDIAQRYGLADLVVTRTFRYSLAELNRAYEDASATFDKVQGPPADPLGLSMDIQRNQLVVQVLQGHQLTAGQSSWRDALAQRHPGLVATDYDGKRAMAG